MKEAAQVGHDVDVIHNCYKYMYINYKKTCQALYFVTHHVLSEENSSFLQYPKKLWIIRIHIYLLTIIIRRNRNNSIIVSPYRIWHSQEKNMKKDFKGNIYI